MYGLGPHPRKENENSLTVKCQLVELCDVGSSPISREVSQQLLLVHYSYWPQASRKNKKNTF